MSSLKTTNILHPSSASNNIVLDSSGNIAVQAGTAGAPAIQANGDSNTGIYFPAADNIGFTTGGTIRGRWTTDGLCFNADTAAGNALDDYEEGTWTPTIAFGSGSASVANAVCRYIKIGTLVHISGRFTLTSVSSPGGGLTIGGLPFNVDNPSGDGNRSGIQVYFENAASNVGSDIIGLLADGGTSFEVRRSGTTGAGSDMGGYTGASTVILIGGNYRSS